MKRCILFIIMLWSIWGCHTDEVMTYDTGRYVYFTTGNGIDSIHVSFANYPDKNELTLYFEVNLIGDLFVEPTPYVLEVVDSLTTASRENYVFPETPLFKPYRTSDTLAVTIKNSDNLKATSELLVIAIGEGEFAIPGLRNQHQIKILYDAIPCKPLWWNDDITKIYLGEYSDKKYKEFVLYTKVSDLTGVPESQIRAYALKFKKYVEDNNIMDEDLEGNEFPMEIPVY